jgi:long-chain fatty acid transport protein
MAVDGEDRAIPSTVTWRAGRRAAAAALALALATSWSAQVSASPQDVLGFGARSSSLAGAGRRVRRGLRGRVHQPLAARAREAQGARARLHGSGLPARSERSARIRRALGRCARRRAAHPAARTDRRSLRAGVRLLHAFDLIVRSRILYPETPQHLLPDSVESIAAIVGLGVDIGWGVRVGGGFEALAALSGSVLASVDASGQLGAVVQDTLVANYAPIVGASVDLPAGFRVGATLRGALEGRFDVRIDIKDLGQITVPPIFVSGTAQYDPLTVEVEGRAGRRAAQRVAVGRVPALVRIPRPGRADGALSARPADARSAHLRRAQGAPPPASMTRRSRGRRSNIRSRSRLGSRSICAPATRSSPPRAPSRPARTTCSPRRAAWSGWALGTAVFEPIVRGVRVDTFGQVGVVHGRTHVKDAATSPQNPGFPQIETGGTMFAAGATMAVAF